MKKILLLFIIVFLSIPHIYSQEDLFDDAEFFLSTEEYEEALYLFLQLSKKFPENHNFQYKVGISYLNIPGKEIQAIPFLEKAVENTSLKYRDKDYRIKDAPHHAWFYLGNAYRINNELDKALESYATFMDIRNFEKNYNLRIVENEIQACQRAKIIKDSPVKLEKQNPGPVINSTPHNFQPVVNTEETAMVFMQRLKFYDAIMYSVKKDGEWSSPVNITPQVGSDGDMIPTGISPDGSELLLVKASRFGNKDIYISKLKGNLWSRAEELSDKINSVRNEDHASFSTDGKMILFSSDRRGGYGKLDIYKSVRLNNDTWSPPENLGKTINTEEDETSAFLAMNDLHLYFASQSHFNMGGFDIFFSEKQNNEWTDPVNIGYPLNTTGDNKYYQPVKKGNTGYISLIGSDTNLNEEDIYRVEIFPLSKIPFPQKTMLNKSFKLEIINPETGETITVNYEREKDEFRIHSTKSVEYELKIIGE